MLCEPTLRFEAESVATPLPFNVDEPRVLEPSENVTEPVGVPLPFGFTLAMKVATSPGTDGFAEEVIAVLVLTLALVASEELLPPQEARTRHKPAHSKT